MKRLALSISLLLSSHIASAEAQDIFSEQLNDLNTPGKILPQDFGLNNSFFQFPSPPAISEEKKAYLEVIKQLKNKEFKTAEQKINQLLKQYPDEAEFYNLQALLGTYTNDTKLATKSYQQALSLDANNLTANLGLSLLAIVNGKYKKAEDYANKAISINDQAVYGYLLLADIAHKDNREQDIEAYLLTAMDKVQGNVKQEITVANRLSLFYTSHKKPKRVLGLAENIVKRHPGNSLALSFLARAQLLNNKIQLAQQTLEELIAQHPGDIQHRLILANIFLKQAGNEGKAAQLLNEALTIDPENPAAHIQKTAFLIHQKSFPEALAQANRVRQLTPGTGKAELLEGDIYLAQNKLDKALASYQISYQLQPSDKIANQIIKVMLAQNRQQDAINFLNKALERDSDNLDTHYKLATIYLQQGNTSKAEKHFQFILEKQPDNVLVLNNLAWMYHQQNNPKALLLAEKAYKKAPNAYAVADTYGVILVKQGDLKKGVEILQKASQMAPSVYDIKYHLANAYALQGNNNQAITLLNLIVKSEQSFPEKESAVKLLDQLNH